MFARQVINDIIVQSNGNFSTTMIEKFMTTNAIQTTTITCCYNVQMIFPLLVMGILKIVYFRTSSSDVFIKFVNRVHDILVNNLQFIKINKNSILQTDSDFSQHIIIFTANIY